MNGGKVGWLSPPQKKKPSSGRNLGKSRSNCLNLSGQFGINYLENPCCLALITLGIHFEVITSHYYTTTPNPSPAMN